VNGILGRLLGRHPADGQGAREARWVVVDCETSGLDPTRDRLLALGAIALRDGRVALDETFEAVLRSPRPSATENILVHGIGADAQLAGRDPGEALPEFSRFLGASVPVAFHAPFDAAILRRAMPTAGADAPRIWLDVAQLAPALFPGRPHRALDDWLGEFGIAPLRRHDALGDALATAQLFLVLIAEAARQGAHHAGDLRRLAREARWLGAR
jgi:DNA polymerase-3 subunit epsilon